MKNSSFKKLFLDRVFKFYKNKDKNHHTPLFIGNEIKYLNECIKTTYVSYAGSFVKKFEKKLFEYIGKKKYIVATSSGTSALHLILNYCKINNDHEVLAPSFTYIATVNPILYLNSNINFVDVENKSFGICPVKLDLYLKKITIIKNGITFNKFTGKQIKALIAVHMYGFACQIIKIKKICKKYRIILIEDAAEAFGTWVGSKHVGTFGDFGIFSFNGNKIITCGGGGAIISKSDFIRKKLKHLTVHAKLSTRKDNYHNKVGFNYGMTNLSAAVGCAQLENFDKILKLKKKNLDNFIKKIKNIKGIEIINKKKNMGGNYWLLIVKFNSKRDKDYVLNTLLKKKYGVRYFWRPLHTLPIFKKFPKDNLKNSNKIFNLYFTMPSSCNLSL